MIPVVMPGVILNACEGSLGVNDENFRYAQNELMNSIRVGSNMVAVNNSNASPFGA